MKSSIVKICSIWQVVPIIYHGLANMKQVTLSSKSWGDSSCIACDGEIVTITFSYILHICASFFFPSSYFSSKSFFKVLRTQLNATLEKNKTNLQTVPNKQYVFQSHVRPEPISSRDAAGDNFISGWQPPADMKQRLNKIWMRLIFPHLSELSQYFSNMKMHHSQME